MGDSKKRVLVLVDSRLRDLPGLVLLKYLLESRHDCDVKLVSRKTERHEIVIDYKPHVVILPHMWRPRWVEFARFLQNLGVLVVILPTEWVASKQYLEYIYEDRSFSPEPSLIDLQLLFNQPTREWMVEHGSALEDRVEVVGVPRFDFYLAERLKRTFSHKEVLEKYDLDRRRPLITWATAGFKTSFLADEGTPEDFLHTDRETVMDRIPKQHIASSEQILQDVQSRSRCFELIKGLIHAYPQANFIIKVHPFEPPGQYERFVQYYGLDNVRVIDNEYIWPIMFATDVHIHQRCATAIEAWLLGKPTLFLPVDEAVSSLDNSDAFNNYEATPTKQELIARVGHYLNGGSVSTELMLTRERYLTKLCYRLDGKASERTAQAIHKLLRRNHHATIPREAHFLGERVLSKLKSVGRFILRRDRTGGTRSKQIPAWRAQKRLIQQQDVQDWTGLIAESFQLSQTDD